VQSVLDTKKEEVIVVTKMGGYYMIVGGTGGSFSTLKVQGAKTQKIESPIPTPTVIPEVKTEERKETYIPKKHCLLFCCW
jgi:hypothetical protein